MVVSSTPRAVASSLCVWWRSAVSKSAVNSSTVPMALSAGTADGQYARFSSQRILPEYCINCQFSGYPKTYGLQFSYFGDILLTNEIYNNSVRDKRAKFVELATKRVTRAL